MKKFSLPLLMCSVISLGSCSYLPPLQVQTDDSMETPVAIEMPKTTEDRVTVLEQEVIALRQEMNLIRPAIKDLIAKRAMGVKKTSVTKATAVVPATYKGPAKLANIRSGEHSGKTRLVMDVGSDTKFSYDLDNEEKILIIELPSAPQDQEMKASFKNSPYIASYKTEKTEGGSRVVILLKQPVKVMAAEMIKAEGSRGARIFFDIGKK